MALEFDILDFDTVLDQLDKELIDPATITALHVEPARTLQVKEIVRFVNLELLLNCWLEVTNLLEVSALAALDKLRHITIIIRPSVRPYDLMEEEAQTVSIDFQNIPDTLLVTFIKNHKSSIRAKLSNYNWSFLLFDPKALYSCATLVYRDGIVWFTGGIVFIPLSVITLASYAESKSIFIPEFAELSAFGTQPGNLTHSPHPMAKWVSAFDLLVVSYNLKYPRVPISPNPLEIVRLKSPLS